MSASFQYDQASQLCELTIRGLLKRSDLAIAEAEMARRIDSGEQPRVLVIIENFGGWQKGDDWNNLDFMFSYGDKIAKIAIVGAGDKQAEVKAFTGAGLRPTPVEFFESVDAARVWLAEESANSAVAFGPFRFLVRGLGSGLPGVDAGQAMTARAAAGDMVVAAAHGKERFPIR